MTDVRVDSTAHAADQAPGLTRRDILLGMAVTAALGATGTVSAAMSEHGMHDHSKHRAQKPELLQAVNGCVDKGRRCIAHCLAAFREGDVSMADCASKVHEMEAICTAFSYLLAANSVYVRDYAEICKQACTDCEKECRVHEDKHIECRDCAEACADTIAEIERAFV